MDTDTLQRMNREYVENGVHSAQPMKIVTMLYRVAIDSLTAAIEHLRTHDHFARSREVTRAEQAVQELLVALDPSVKAPFTRTLADLYRYSLQRIIAGHASQSEEAFREALSVLATLAAAWREVEAQMCNAKPAEESGAEPSPEQQQTPVSDRCAAYQGPEFGVARDWSC